MQNSKIPWSNNWWIEDDRAWFCSGEISTLFCTNLKSGKCEFVARIPETDNNWLYKYPYCIKYRDSIFCLPYLGKNVWSYDVIKETWEKIEIANTSYLVFFQNSYRQEEEHIWLSEDETGRLFELNLEKKMVESIASIPRDSGGEYVLVENKLYCTSGYKIYCVDIFNCIYESYHVSGIKDEIYAICFDGINFWLGSCYKEIYIWNPKRGIIKTISEFPEPFGFYHFKRETEPYLDCASILNPEYTLFSPMVALGEHIWCISCRSNGIIYIDKNSYQVFYLEVEGEQETQESIGNNLLGYKFQFEYIREDRYIGIYSVKNHCIFEIDTVDLCVRRKTYELDFQSILRLAEAVGYYEHRHIFRESSDKDCIVFNANVAANNKKKKAPLKSIGEQIYRTI